MRCSVIDARELTDAEAAKWSRIQSANAVLGSPYFCPGFTRAVGAVRDDVRVAILEDGAATVGYFPFQIGRLGRGRPVGGPLSDYQAVISERNEGWNAQDLIRGAGMSAWKFDHLLCAQQPFAGHVTATFASPLMDLTKGYDAYVESRQVAGDKPFHRLATLRRRIEREVAPLRFEASCTDPAALRQLLAWKSAQCKASGSINVFGARWTNDLVERLLHTHEPDGFGGILSTLHAGDDLLAAHFGMRSQTVWHYWFPSYHHGYGNFSPGLLMLLDMAKTAQSLGLHVIDLGKGDAPYKTRMMSYGVPIAEGRIELPSIAASVRQLRVRSEAWLRASPIAEQVRVPGRALKRLERWLRFR